jgi:thiamine transport system permease protein
MAECREPMRATLPGTSRTLAGLALAGVIAAMLAGFLPVVLLGLTEGLARSDPYLLHVIAFTLLQATLSTVLSVAIALPIARALARRRFAGRAMVVRLFALPLALPSIVVILGIVEVYGARGWLGGWFALYGLTGILIAHVFFNFPLAARLMLTRLETVPAESFRLAAQLGFRDRDVFRRIEWPEIVPALPGIATLIFLLCTASFAVVLTLGGGPSATTLEVAIYQALRFDFDPARAAALALAQLAICGLLTVFAGKFAGISYGTPPLRRHAIRFDGSSTAARLGDGLALALGLAILLPPLAAIVFAGLAGLRASPGIFTATAISLGLGAAAALTGVALGWPLAQTAARSPFANRVFPVAALAALIMPPAVLATGWFILLSRYSDVTGLAPVLVIAMNGLMALPFVYGTLAPALRQSAAANDRLCAGLGLTGFTRFRVIDLPSLRKPIGLALLMAAIVSLGDLTAITLFGTQDFTTLPSLIYRQMGSYRMQAAAGSALILALFALGLITLAERWSAQDDRA